MEEPRGWEEGARGPGSSALVAFSTQLLGSNWPLATPDSLGCNDVKNTLPAPSWPFS